MDSFPHPYNGLSDDQVSIDQVRAQVRALEQQHRASGIKLSGTVIHVCHALPITPSLAEKHQTGVLSPPATPPPPPQLPTPHRKSTRWSLTPRYGHAAMISGIRSLSATHQQVIIGWTGDILSSVPGETLSPDSISDNDKASLELALKSYHPSETSPTEDDNKITYVPVWLDSKVAHGHYEGYCKTSPSCFPYTLSTP
jgi:trehalose 6-phosphate synthase/phosphatase